MAVEAEQQHVMAAVTLLVDREILSITGWHHLHEAYLDYVT